MGVDGEDPVTRLHDQDFLIADVTEQLPVSELRACDAVIDGRCLRRQQLRLRLDHVRARGGALRVLVLRELQRALKGGDGIVEELLLRIEAILRRAAAAPVAVSRLNLGLCSFDPARGELFRGPEPIRLTEAETQLMRQLSRAVGAPVDRLELARATADATGRAVDIQVTRLRRKIEADPKNPRYLQTVRGVGYMLAPD